MRITNSLFCRFYHNHASKRNELAAKFNKKWRKHKLAPQGKS